MKKNSLFYLCISLVFTAQSQLVKHIQVSTAGSLSSLLTVSEKASVTNLLVTGTIDAQDFKAMRDSMPLLSVLDISNTIIVSYSGTNGTSHDSGDYPTDYLANSIPQYAFMKTDQGGSIVFNTSLTTVNLPNTIISLDECCFYQCNQLMSLNLCASINNIGPLAFYGCSAIISVDANNTVYSSADGVLFNKLKSKLIHYPSLSSVSYTVPSTVDTIGYNSFGLCEKVSAISIPLTVKYIDYFAFTGCGALISVDSRNEKYSSLDGVLFNNKIDTLIFCPTSKSGRYVIPNSVQVVLDEAFFNCKDLNTITIPSNVISIGSLSFSGCTSLSSIYAYSKSPIDLSGIYNPFDSSIMSNCNLYVPVGSSSLYSTSSYWMDFTKLSETSFLTNLSQSVGNLATVTVYPNPVTDYLYIDGLQEISNLSIMDMSGKTILAKQIRNHVPVDISNLVSGIYVIRLRTAQGILERKIMKN